MHRPGLAPQSSPRRAPALSPARPPAAERRGRPARPWRRPWLRWWSTRASRPATTAATANPRRARCPAVSVPVHGARCGRLASPPRTARRAPATPRRGARKLGSPYSRFPFPLASSRTDSFHSASHPHRRWSSLSQEGTEIAESCPGPRWRGRRQRRGAAARPGPPAPVRLRVRLRAARCIVGWRRRQRQAGLRRVIGPGPWLPGPLCRPASWSISRARTFTAVAIARTSREVAPMVSWPAGRRGRASRSWGLRGWRASSGVVAAPLGPVGSSDPRRWSPRLAPVSWRKCGTQLPQRGHSCCNLKRTSAD